MRAAVIGLGHMGMGMAKNLLAGGHEVIGYDLSAAAMNEAATAGIGAATSADAAVTDVDVVITVLPSAAHVRDTYRGSPDADGLLSTARPGTVFMDCSTVSVADARDLAQSARDAGHRAIDAPISGGMRGALDGTLTFMIGGSEEDFEAVRPLTDAMGSHSFHCGDNGSGQAAKICNNMLLCINQIGAAETFTLASRLGIDPRRLHEIISTSSGQSWSVTVTSPVPGTVPSAPSSNNFAPGAVPAVLAKDLGLAAEAMKTAGYAADLGSRAREIYDGMADSEFADQDFSGVINYIQAQLPPVPGDE